MLPRLDRDAFHQFAFRWDRDKYFIDKFRPSYPREIFNLSEHTAVTAVIPVEEALESISEVLIPIKLLGQCLTDPPGANDQHIASSNALLDPADHNPPLYVPPYDHRQDIQYQSTRYH